MIKLLIVEPEEILRVGLTAVLSQDDDLEILGFAATADEASMQLEGGISPDALLLDESLDANLIAAAADAGIPCILFSNRSDSEAIFEALGAGCTAYILKGSSIALLVSAIKAVGSGATWLDPGIAKKAMEVIKAAHNAGRRNGPNPVLGGKLSQRETEVLSLLCEGLPNQGIAKVLFVSGETVKTHVRHIMEKLQVSTRTEAAVQGIKLGIVNDERTTKELTLSR